MSQNSRTQSKRSVDFFHKYRNDYDDDGLAAVAAAAVAQKMQT